MDSGRHDQSLVLGRSRPGYEDHESGADMRRWPSSTSTTRMALSDALLSLASGSQASDHNSGESCIRRESSERKRSTNRSESGDIGSGISGVRDRNNAEPSTATGWKENPEADTAAISALPALGDVSLDPYSSADDVGDIKRSFEIAEKALDGCLDGFQSDADCQTLNNRVQDAETAQFTVTNLGGEVVDTETPAAQFYAGSPTETDLGGPPTDLNGCVGTPVRAPSLFGPSLEDPPEDEPTPVQCVDPSEGDALDPPGIYDSNATSGERGLEPIASTEISSLRTIEHSNIARSSRGIDPPSHAFFQIQDNGVIDAEVPRSPSKQEQTNNQASTSTSQ
ncbi:hypothetical protein THAOC_16260, partial [Thalassiosira oceanica]